MEIWLDGKPFALMLYQPLAKRFFCWMMLDIHVCNFHVELQYTIISMQKYTIRLLFSYNLYKQDKHYFDFDCNLNDKIMLNSFFFSIIFILCYLQGVLDLFRELDMLLPLAKAFGDASTQLIRAAFIQSSSQAVQSLTNNFKQVRKVVGGRNRKCFQLKIDHQRK